jgi:hypothetical protein
MARSCDHPPRKLRTWIDKEGLVKACQACGRLLEGEWKLRLPVGGTTPHNPR